MFLHFGVVLMFFGVSSGISLDKNYKILNLPLNFTNRLEEYLNRNENGKISQQCRGDLLQFRRSLLSLKIEDIWAKQMFDAGTKIPSGLLEGSAGDLGSFDECLKIEARTDSYEIFGQHCVGVIPLSSMLSYDKRNALLLNNPETRGMAPDGSIGMYLATCLPNGCSPSEIQDVYSGIGLGMVFYDNLCQTKLSKPELASGSIATISFLGIILWLMLASTAYDGVLHYLNKKTYHPLLIAFSIVTNTKKILATSNGSDHISCLHGIRVISTMWVILGHRYSIQNVFPAKNFFDIFDWMQEQGNMFIMGGTVSVDTFFLMAGMVISYIYMTSVSKGVKFNILIYYFHRYIRLTPVLAVVILIHVTLLKHFGSGPLWPYVIQRDLAAACQANWWKALLYIQNYGIGEVGTCVPQSWYLSVDMQLFLLSPILLIPLKRWPMSSLAATSFLTLCSIITCFLTGWFFELNHGLLANLDPATAENYMKYYYIATQTRAAPWLIGIILGYIIFTLQHRTGPLVINKLLVVAVWVVSLAVLCTCVFAGHVTIKSEYDRVASSFHLALVRPAWAVALSLIIFICAVGYGGPINWFLSLPIFQVLSKLTFTMYLSHYTVIYFITAQMRDTYRFSSARMLYIFWGDFALTLAVSFVLTLAFESPIITIEKVLFRGVAKKSVPQVNEEYKTKPAETA